MKLSNSMQMGISKLLFVISTLVVLSSSVSAQVAASSPTGPFAGVTVRRDARSIPYIQAKTDSELYFAQGYITASDRLWQMDVFRRVARGETSEIFGRTTLEEDKRWRRFGFAKVADDSIAHLSPELAAALKAYSEGVNAYIRSLDDKTLPIEFKILQYKPREWTPADSIIIGKILADALSSTWRSDLLRASVQGLPKEKLAELSNQVTPHDVVLFGRDTRAAATGGSQRALPVTPATLLAARVSDETRTASLSRIGMYAEDLAASNNWVISGKRTADGKTMLANDPHLMPTAPGIWYLSHLATPAMRVAGVTLPGVPGIVLGHNEHFAWGATNVGPDVQDLVIETFDTEGKYKTPSGAVAPVIRNEQIKVRANPLSPSTEPVALDVTVTRNGPIILEEGGKRYALKWTALDPKNQEFEAFFRLNRAKDWNGFKDALRSYGGSTQNFVYADVKGNIGWYAAGRIPIRKVGIGQLPYDGATSDGDWTGYIPFEELPNLYNPAEGFIVTANQRIAGTDYKYQQITHDASSWRARRIYDLLKADSKVTIDDSSAIQHDVYNIPLANLSRQIVAQNGGSAETIALMKDWDGKMTPDSKAALIANEIRGCLSNKIADESRPAPPALIRERILDRAVAEKSALWLPKAYPDYPTFLKACDSEARVSLADPKRLGPDESKWNWGALSKARFPHPLAIAPLIGGQFATPTDPIAGSGQTPNVASAVSMRLIATPGNWDATRHVIPLGQSGDPRSPHFKDQFEMWKTGQPAVFPFSEQAINAATKVVALP